MDVPTYDPSIVNTVTDSSIVSWGDATPILFVLGVALLFGGFALTMMLREWAWLNQWDDELNV